MYEECADFEKGGHNDYTIWSSISFPLISNKHFKSSRLTITVLLERVYVIRVFIVKPYSVALPYLREKWSVQCDHGRVYRGPITMSALCSTAVQNEQKSGLTKQARNQT